MKQHFSQRVRGAKRSAIRELLKLTEQPDIISFGGGLPAPESFPNKELAEIAYDELLNNSANVLQYGTTEGSRTLRDAFITWLEPQGIHTTRDELLVTTASQQGLDLLCKAFFDPGDVLFCGLPTYLGAVQAFKLFQIDTVGVLLEDDGMSIEELEAQVAACKAAGKTMKGIYVIPDFQNPSGITLSLEKRKQILDIARREDLLVFEDNPYGHLRFAGESIPSLYSMDTDGRVIMLVTFSKILSAGLRLAVMITSQPDLMDALVRTKQATDLCTSKLTQHLAARYMLEYGLDKHLEDIRPIYREKRNAMIDALEKHMPKGEGIRWTEPDGGLFVWVWLPEGIDAQDMLARAIEQKVAYVPGSAAFVDGSGHNTMRLAFSSSTPEKINEGIRRLASVVKAEIAANKVGTS
ncbi:PLP-dependent aminotransferase family protein [Candidatus Bipolaricaulota bacterium]|jgi:2-aminoadipate transaminase|nr:PLP-dependent aminotransferase family protein [Candidatus Bipolaricaulota bacterium]TFH08730.1 MAG: PLP-dependent aminotransferase family protein [Candidatus Atribacteria bacterium]